MRKHVKRNRVVIDRQDLIDGVTGRSNLLMHTQKLLARGMAIGDFGNVNGE